jgi:hypothetical protein
MMTRAILSIFIQHLLVWFCSVQCSPCDVIFSKAPRTDKDADVYTRQVISFDLETRFKCVVGTNAFSVLGLGKQRYMEISSKGITIHVNFRLCENFFFQMNVLIIGGSVTAGYDLPSREFTWANQIKSALSRFCDVNVMSGSGQGSAYFMSDVHFWSRIVKEPKIDVIIAEFSVNDQYFGSDEYGNAAIYPEHIYNFIDRVKQVRGDVNLLFVNTFRLGEIYSRKDAPPDRQLRTNSTGYDILILPNDSILYTPSHYWSIASMQQTVLREVGIPYFSYRDLVYPFRLTPRRDLETFWRGSTVANKKLQHCHPDELAHTLLAAGTIHTMGLLCEQARGVKLSFDRFPSVRSVEYNITPADALVEACPHAAQILRGEHFPSASSKGKWRYGEDEMSHHKIAWTIRGSSTDDNEIVFDLIVGPKRQLIVENLRSWQMCGRANVYLGEGSTQHKVASIPSFQKRLSFTLPAFQTIDIPPAKEIGSSIVSGQERIKVRLQYIPVDKGRVQALQQMFMLYSMATC